MKRLLAVVICVVSSFSTARGSGNGLPWRLSTDDTTMVIAVRQGTPVVIQLGSSKDNSNWLVAPAPEILLPTITQHGLSTRIKWQYQGGAFDPKSGELVLRFSNLTPALDLRSVWRARPGHGPIEHWLTITNKSGAVVTVGHQDSLMLSHVAVPAEEPMDAWWIKRGGGNATTEGGTFVQTIGKHTDQTLISNPTDGASPVPWLALQVGTSRGLYVGWEFSGVGRIHFHSLSVEGNAATASPPQLGIEIGNIPAFKTDIEAGETFVVPPAFVGCYQGDIDDGSYTLHRFVLEKLVPRFPKGYVHPTLDWNLYDDSGEYNADEKSILRSAALAKELGFETFEVDAIWFPQSGDWRWDPRRFPHGSQPIESFVHSQDMKFGLWMAYTHGSPSDSPEALNVAQHPDWFAEPPKLDPQRHINWRALIDLGYGPARDWAEQATQRVVSQYGVDYLKTDYTPIVTQCQQTNHRHRYGVDVSYWSTLGYYAVQDALLRKFPHLIIEGCSGGGHIKDFGDIQHVHAIAVNDTLSALPDRQAIYDSTFAFPPAVLATYTSENRFTIVSDMPEPYLWRSAMMSQWNLDPTHAAGWTADQRAKLKRATEIYKSWIRPILQNVEVRHILPRPDGFHWDGMFYWSPSLKRGTLYIFRPNSDVTTQQIYLKGLVPGRKYEVRAEDHSTPQATYSGTQLMKSGLKIKLPSKYTSDLVYVEAIF